MDEFTMIPNRLVKPVYKALSIATTLCPQSKFEELNLIRKEFQEWMNRKAAERAAKAAKAG